MSTLIQRLYEKIFNQLIDLKTDKDTYQLFINLLLKRFVV